MDPPPAPDSSYPRKTSPKTQQTVTPNIPSGDDRAASLHQQITETRTVPLRTTTQTPSTGQVERRPEAPRKLDRTATLPTAQTQENTIPFSAPSYDGTTSRQQSLNTPAPTGPIASSGPTIRIERAPDEEVITKTEPLPAPPVNPVVVNQPRPEPAQTVPERPVRQRTARLSEPREPASLDAVMPSTREVESFDGTLTIADSGVRLGAFLMDVLLTLIIVTGVVYLLSIFAGARSLNWSLTAVVLVFCFFLLVNWLMLPAFSGQTIGKKVMGITVIRTNGQPLGLGGTIKRHLIGYPLSTIPLMFGFLRILWDSNCQGWHDKLAKTVVVKVV